MHVSYVRESVLTRGKGKNAAVLDVYNGRMHLTLTPDNCLDIYRLAHRGDNIGFCSVNGYTYGRTEPFNATFPGGFLYTCGLEAIGSQKGLPQHGTVHHLPAEEMFYSTDEGRVEIRGRMRDSQLFGKNLVLERRILLEEFSDTLKIEDRICNEGFGKSSYVLLYHFNLGYPMLDAETSVEGLSPESGMTAYASERMEKALRMSLPNKPEEQCFSCKSEGKIRVRNSKLGKNFVLYYDSEKLPVAMEWKSMVPGNYALGIEPATCSLAGERQYRTICPGEYDTYVFQIDIGKYLEKDQL